MYSGVTKDSGFCPLCEKDIEISSVVLFDDKKSPGNHLVHLDCWHTLLRSRMWKQPKRQKDRPVRSSARLDPPF